MSVTAVIVALLLVRLPYLQWLLPCLQCFDTVGWASVKWM